MSTPVPPPGLPELPVTFRPTRTRIVLLSTGTALLCVLTALSLMLETFTTGDRITFICTGLFGLGVLALLSRPKVVATEDGVTVTNLTTTRRLAWAQVVRVNLRAGDPWVHLDLSDGTSLPAMGIQTGIAKQQAIADARALRALAETHGTGSSST
ncbi:PH domain-containing protein [Streptomyces sp. SCA3-4]|uniref:PH domain-containing protein n=1 Tax=Streptomyces sichuanensis TaxID=2871810 RepID=UPI001CE32C97|nr:PH domain-containing protein [Streptomyces sichuanensis]MCA6093152.1 PH domain-containing protein [Streptomyces sichuanensis]